MYTNCKYVVLEQEGNEVMFLFSCRVVHKAVSQRMGGRPISAGFVRRSGGELKCLGESESMRMKSRPEEDNILLMELLDL